MGCYDTLNDYVIHVVLIAYYLACTCIYYVVSNLLC